MHVVIEKRLVEFWGKHPDAEAPLRSWLTIMKRVRFTKHNDLRGSFPDVDFVRGKRCVFNIGGKKYRLVVDMRYDLSRAFIVAVMTHDEYSRVDVTTL